MARKPLLSALGRSRTASSRAQHIAVASGAPALRYRFLGADLLVTIRGHLLREHDEASCPEAACRQRQLMADQSRSSCAAECRLALSLPQFEHVALV
jgi:hypothetical protein